MRPARVLAAAVALLLAGVASATADTLGAAANCVPSLVPTRVAHDPWNIDWAAAKDAPFQSIPAVALIVAVPPRALQNDPQGLHAAAIEHSDAYQTRAKIHKYASFATLPLFAAEVVLGQVLYSPPSSGALRTTHAVVGSGIIGLFGVNTVTGAWNMFGEGWSDKDGRTLRLVHGLLMMAADAGFVATAASGPNSEGRRGALTFETDRVTHRNIAIASISVGTAGYLLMLITNH